MVNPKRSYHATRRRLSEERRESPKSTVSFRLFVDVLLLLLLIFFDGLRCFVSMNVSLEHATLKYQRWQGKEIAQQLTTFPLLTRPCARIILCVVLRFVAIVAFIL